ncbi:MAG: hypothetical protein ABL897_08815 [Hyphomicrobium sp.]
MSKILLHFAAAAGLAFAIASGVSAAADATPKATDILFEGKHIAGVAPGTELMYKFVRKPTDEKILGKGYSDDISVKVESDAATAGKKNVLVQMFTGDRAKDPQRITDMDGNPMLIVFLDTALGHFRQLAGGDPSYLKNRFSSSYAKPDAKVEPVKISYKGAEHEGYRVSVSPFANDASRAKMRGFENAEFSIVLSEKIPGHFALMTANYANTQKGAPSLVETMTLDGVGDIK